jgi:hypothetical protein
MSMKKLFLFVFLMFSSFISFSQKNNDFHNEINGESVCTYVKKFTGGIINYVNYKNTPDSIFIFKIKYTFYSESEKKWISETLKNEKEIKDKFPNLILRHKFTGYLKEY